MSACPDREPLLHGLLDGELDAANALECEAHIRTCPGCAAAFNRLQDLRSALSAPGVRHSAPAALGRRIEVALDETARRHREPGAWRLRARKGGPWAFGAIAGALAASLMLVLAPRPDAGALETELVADHVRSLLASHLTDVATSDRHVVKPWFNGRIDFAPPVLELADQGYPLAGGRLDYVKGKVVAALVYRRRQHVINLFVWPEHGHPPSAGETRRDGYTLVRWSRGGLEFWAVSDIDAADLEAFRHAFIARSPA